MVERCVPLDLGGRNQFSLLLNDADFRSAEAMAQAINHDLGRPAARVLDSRRIDLSVANGEEIPSLLARVESIEVPVYPRAKVIVNERTGTVVIVVTVDLQPVSILHGGLAGNFGGGFLVLRPNAVLFATTPVTQP